MDASNDAFIEIGKVLCKHIDRTTLQWREESYMDQKVMGKPSNGQCKIVTTPDRKF